MATTECKACGAPLEFVPGRTAGVCEACGYETSFPEREVRLANFDEGNRLRRGGDYRAAEAVFDSILAEDENDAEAHWCRALCRWRVQYRREEETGRLVPFPGIVFFDSFLADEDYQRAVELTEGEDRALVYLNDAIRIAETALDFWSGIRGKDLAAALRETIGETSEAAGEEPSSETP